jgi:hypothetical protein
VKEALRPLSALALEGKAVASSEEADRNGQIRFEVICMSISTDSLDMSKPDAAARSDGEDAVQAPAPGANRVESRTLMQTGSASARHTRIAEAAYHRAQQRGFAGGEDWQDWFEAEREVDALLDSER